MAKKQDPEKIVREIKRTTRHNFSDEEKIRIVLEGLGGEECSEQQKAASSFMPGQTISPWT